MEISSATDSVSILTPALLEARRTGHPVASEIVRQIDLTVEEAYRIQSEVARATGPVGGFKVANKPDAPRIMAPIFSKDIMTAPAVIDVPRDEEIGIELEVGFRIDRPLPDRTSPNRRDAIAECLSAVAVIEIVRTRLPMDATPVLKLADNQINGGLVVGAPVADWTALSLGSVSASLDLGDDRILDGTAAVPGGDAFENFLVLEDMLGEHCGGLQPGQIVITGSLNGLPYLRAGIDIRGRIDGLGAVSLRLNGVA
ncbi:2-keto-4-pentenoate hydratase [Sedimentitalea sp. JM2-8]|uniref:2-keto-4-pentenoate hydratase n=1 Tax=Sedimentitalea xiamensis TaxID=3050037 RepID=A0ABT7FIS8_9RHOB|nr:2-keto-4-pentenoate hydratase [Sedimentitalea xiamensis]MDK3074997.1 2-keto-4-pentenoate hydratase [Sedimentitalea xiamensis]